MEVIHILISQNGKKGEEYAAFKLKEAGYIIFAINYHSRFGEIDIIATKDDVIAFVEVKTRAKNYLVSPLEAVTVSKQRKIIKTAQYFFMQNEINLQPRFDVYEIVTDKSIGFAVFSEQYIEGAFELNERNRID